MKSEIVGQLAGLTMTIGNGIAVEVVDKVHSLGHAPTWGGVFLFAVCAALETGLAELDNRRDVANALGSTATNNQLLGGTEEGEVLATE